MSRVLRANSEPVPGAPLAGRRIRHALAGLDLRVARVVPAGPWPVVRLQPVNGVIDVPA